jgi:hypothetical protein
MGCLFRTSARKRGVSRGRRSFYLSPRTHMAAVWLDLACLSLDGSSGRAEESTKRSNETKRGDWAGEEASHRSGMDRNDAHWSGTITRRSRVCHIGRRISKPMNKAARGADAQTQFSSNENLMLETVLYFPFNQRRALPCMAGAIKTNFGGRLETWAQSIIRLRWVASQRRTLSPFRLKDLAGPRVSGFRPSSLLPAALRPCALPYP